VVVAAADDLAMAMFTHGSEIVTRHHTVVADEHDTPRPEALIKIA
jgi:hypothetical protein